jgi:hypothetical protein
MSPTCLAFLDCTQAEAVLRLIRVTRSRPVGSVDGRIGACGQGYSARSQTRNQGSHPVYRRCKVVEHHLHRFTQWRDIATR